jgi:hypothetical protein
MQWSSLLCIPLLACLQQSVAAQEGCDKFAWSLARERAWFAATEKPTVHAGQKLSAIPTGAFVLQLQPGGAASFELPPERKPKADRWFGGTVSLPAPATDGIYQITISDEAWIDIVQEHRFVRSLGSTGRSDCAGLRKSVRLDLGAAPFVLQLSGVMLPVITLSITPAAE